MAHAMWRAYLPFNELPPLSTVPPDIESRGVLKLCIEAHQALAELKQAGRAIPNQAVLTNTLPLLEAQASSEIENIVTTRDELFRQAPLRGLENANAAVRETVRYRTALKAGFDRLADVPLATNTAIEVCSTIKDTQMEVRAGEGTFIANHRTGQILYTPPVGESRIRDMLHDLFAFMHTHEAFDPLVRMALGHYQFEAIHPFHDGNGRTGRILNVLYLIDRDLMDVPTLFLSGYVNAHRADYYRLLNAVMVDGAYEEWVAFMIEGVRDSARSSCRRLQAIIAQHEETRRYVQSTEPRVYSRELIDVLFAQPYCRIANVVVRGIAQRQTAALYLHTLVERGVLSQVKIGRDVLFVNDAFLRILLDDAVLEGDPITRYS